jgi:SAM-dependent methyltransferase
VTVDRYRGDLDRAVSFSGASHEFFARAKAEELLWLTTRHLGDPAGLDALDAGCGIGLTDQHLRGRFKSLTGSDISSEALETAAAENPDVRYELAEPDRQPFPSDSFDLVFTVNVVQLIPPDRQPRFLAELTRVTRPDGLIAVFEHNPLNPLTRLVVRRFSSPDEIRLLTMGTAKRLLRSVGVKPVESGYLLLFPSRRSRVLAVERSLRRLPLGAQYYVAGRPV